MSRWIAWIALAIFPLVQLLIINPLRFSWGFHRGAEAMPAELNERANTIDRLLLFPKSMLTVAFIVVLLTRESIPTARVGLRLDQWHLNALLGLSAGLLRIGLQGLSVHYLISKRQAIDGSYLARGSVFSWTFSFLLGAFAEQLWIALCLIALSQAGLPTITSLVITSTVFALAHLPRPFSAVMMIAMYGGFAAALFLWRGSLLPPVVFHFVGNLGVLYWVRHGMARP